MLWAIPGAVLQALGGSRRQLGLLLVTGLLIGGVWAGWMVVLGLAGRLLAKAWLGTEASRASKCSLATRSTASSTAPA